MMRSRIIIALLLAAIGLTIHAAMITDGQGKLERIRAGESALAAMERHDDVVVFPYQLECPRKDYEAWKNGGKTLCLVIPPREIK